MTSSPASESKKPETAAENLLRSMKTTAGSRFRAAKRLESHDKRLTRLTAFTSSYLIMLTVLPYFMKLPALMSDTLNLITVAFSVVVLVSSLLQYSGSEVVRAEQHHRSALEINELRREFMIREGQFEAGYLDSFATRFNAVLQKYSINHDDVDYAQYQIDRPEAFPWVKGGERLVLRLKIAVLSYTPNVFLIIVTLVFLWLVFFYALPAREIGH